MTVMLDIIGATVLVGMLMMTIMSVNINVSDQNFKGLSEYHIHTELIQLSRIIEFDFYKMGYRIQGPGKICIADTSHIKYYTDLYDVNGEKDSIEYNLAYLVTSTPNPVDRALYRYENTTRVWINYSVIQFRLKYFNANEQPMTTPVTGAYLDSIKSVRVLLTLQSPIPFDTARIGGSAYAGTYYQKQIYPRNL